MNNTATSIESIFYSTGININNESDCDLCVIKNNYSNQSDKILNLTLKLFD